MLNGWNIYICICSYRQSWRDRIDNIQATCICNITLHMHTNPIHATHKWHKRNTTNTHLFHFHQFGIVELWKGVGRRFKKLQFEAIRLATAASDNGFAGCAAAAGSIGRTVVTIAVANSWWWGCCGDSGWFAAARRIATDWTARCSGAAANARRNGRESNAFRLLERWHDDNWDDDDVDGVVILRQTCGLDNCTTDHTKNASKDDDHDDDDERRATTTSRNSFCVSVGVILIGPLGLLENLSWMNWTQSKATQICIHNWTHKQKYTTLIALAIAYEKSARTREGWKDRWWRWWWWR